MALREGQEQCTHVVDKLDLNLCFCKWGVRMPHLGPLQDVLGPHSGGARVRNLEKDPQHTRVPRVPGHGDA